MRQTASVAEYKGQFEALFNRLKEVFAKTKLSCFIGGLKDEIQFSVKLLNPTTLHQAFGIAKMQKEFVSSWKKSTRVTGGSMGAPFTHSTKPNIKTTLPIHKISPAQMKERRYKGLCYFCDEKWNPRHKCETTKLYFMDGGEEEDYTYVEEVGDPTEQTVVPKLNMAVVELVHQTQGPLG